MKPLPMPLRIAAGLVATAIEETRELPRKLVELPVSAVSRVLQVSMRMQQRVTELAIKGDQALGGLRPVPETPAWARFDEDEPLHSFGTANGLSSVALPAERDDEAPPRRVSAIPVARAPEPGYNLDKAAEPDAKSAVVAGADPAVKAALPAPADPPDPPDGPAGLADYDQWSLPQLRGRFRSLSLEQVRALLGWETSHQDRPPYVTMLSNRVASITGR